MEFLARLVLEEEALNFFKLSQPEKDMSGPPNLFSYGSKKIGRNCNVRELVKEYVVTVKNMTCEVVEMIAEKMGMSSKDTLSKMIRDEHSEQDDQR